MPICVAAANQPRHVAPPGGETAFRVRGGLSSQAVKHVRRCTRTGCSRSAVATLTYAYADLTAVVGPLATYSEPHSYDLCEEHAVRLTVPRGWEVVRLDQVEAAAVTRSSDDLEALADAVREAARPAPSGFPAAAAAQVQSGRRGHLRALPTPS